MSDETVGTAVHVDGVIVAWFSEFDEEALEWCREKYFGRWLTWRASPPTLIPLTAEEEAEIEKKVEEWRSKIVID